MRAAQYIETLDAGRQWNRALDDAPVRFAVSTISIADWSISR